MTKYRQSALFPDYCSIDGKKQYKPILTAVENRKGVLDVDTVKGCSIGLKHYPIGGCYGECYAYKIAKMYGIDFASVSRKPSRYHFADIFHTIKNHHAAWYRIGTAGDPCHDWENTIDVCERLKDTGKIPVIITKHWIVLTDVQLARLANAKAVINTSTSGMDTNEEIAHRVKQLKRIKGVGMRSVCRIVTCNYGDTVWGKQCKEKQDYLLSLLPAIDNPLRLSKSNYHLSVGNIIAIKKDESIGGGKLVSLHSDKAYIGHCSKCIDQCGVINNKG